jgi:hypothetical protein
MDKEYKIVKIPISNQDRLVKVGKLIQKGLAQVYYFSMDKVCYKVKRGNKV